jgi:tetratricopeptide (TPR) repeat protein
LSQALYFLRAHLGPAAIRSIGKNAVTVESDGVWSDLWAFRAAIEAGDPEEAARVYGGHLLPGFHLSDCSSFEDWLGPTRERYRQSALKAVRMTADKLESHGDIHGALGFMKAGARWAPFDETLMLRVVELAAQAGDVGQALEEFERFTARLNAELGVTPSPEVWNQIELIRRRSEQGRLGGSPGSTGEHDLDRAELPPVHPVIPGETVGPLDEPLHVRHARSRPTTRSIRSRFARIEQLPGWRSMLAVSMFFAAGAAAAAAFAGRQPSTETETPPDPVVVITPFENLTGDTGADPVGQWVAEALTAALQDSPWPRVVVSDSVPAEVSAARARGSSAAVGTLSGSFVMAEGDPHFRLRVQGPNGEVVVSAKVPRPQASSPPQTTTLTDQTLGALAMVMDPRMPSWVPGGSPPPDLEAYRSFVGSVESFYEGSNNGNLDSAFAAFGQPSGSADAWAAPLIWQLMILRWQWEFSISRPSSLALPPILDEADSLVAELEGRRSRLKAWESAMLDHYVAWLSARPVPAHLALRRALSQRPGTFWEIELARSALNVARPGEAIAALERLDRDAADMGTWRFYWGALTDAYHYAGQFEEELGAAELADEVRVGIGFRARIRALVAAGRADEAFAIADAFYTDWPAPRTFYWNYLMVVRIAQEFRAHGYSSYADRLFSRFALWSESAPADQLASLDHRWGAATLALAVGRWAEAVRLFEELAAEVPAEPSFLGPMAVASARLGDVERATDIARQLKALGESRTGRDASLWAAAVLAHMGDLESGTRGLWAATHRWGLIDGGTLGGFLHVRPELEPFLGLSAEDRMRLLPSFAREEYEPPCPDCPF